jgi:hypothetical protein
MKTQIKILGTIDLLLGFYFAWTLVPLYESPDEFIRNEFMWTLTLVGLLIGGIGLWNKLKIGWVANQLIGIHIILSTLIGVVVISRTSTATESESDFYLILFLVVIAIGLGLFWTNRKQWLDEFSISNRFRLTTVLIGAMISLAFLIWSTVKHYAQQKL